MASVLLRENSEPGPETGVCTIIVLFEDNCSRDAAIRLCTALEKTFHSEFDFEITWCRFKYFNDPAVVGEAAETAAHADLILVAIQRADDLPLEVKAWFERWLPNRQSEGALVLLQTSEPPSGPTISQSPYLYLLAQRANLDYISLSDAADSACTGLPENLMLSRPLDLDSNRNSQHYSRSGINE